MPHKKEEPLMFRNKSLKELQELAGHEVRHNRISASSAGGYTRYWAAGVRKSERWRDWE